MAWSNSNSLGIDKDFISINRGQGFEYFITFSHPSQFKFGDIILKPDVNIEDVSSLSKCIIFRKDDILINGLNLNYDFVTQRIARANYTGIITSAYIAVRVRNNLSSKYVTYLFKALDSRKVFNGLGTGIRLTLTYKELKNIIFYYLLKRNNGKLLPIWIISQTR